MKPRLATYAAACGLVALAATCAHAQENGSDSRPAARRAQARALNALAIPAASIDALVKLSDEQKTKLAALQEKLAADEKALRTARGATPDPENVRKRAEVRKQAQQEAAALLTAEQKTALRAAMKWAAPLNRANVPWTALADLKLTDKQKADIEAIGADIQAKQRALPRGAAAGARREAMLPLNADLRARVMGVLTDEQKTAIEKVRRAARSSRGKRGAPPPEP